MTEQAELHAAEFKELQTTHQAQILAYDETRETVSDLRAQALEKDKADEDARRELRAVQEEVTKLTTTMQDRLGRYHATVAELRQARDDADSEAQKAYEKMYTRKKNHAARLQAEIRRLETKLEDQETNSKADLVLYEEIQTANEDKEDQLRALQQRTTQRHPERLSTPMMNALFESEFVAPRRGGLLTALTDMWTIYDRVVQGQLDDGTFRLVACVASQILSARDDEKLPAAALELLLAGVMGALLPPPNVEAQLFCVTLLETADFA
ncbi:hypothetical protein F5Y04DRAFT_283554 [Hypomontagnella monticulosa]|nr:hypothetical protein F5Y04DRAFT_283554 [Hypomontagnella monticulosa]